MKISSKFMLIFVCVTVLCLGIIGPASAKSPGQKKIRLTNGPTQAQLIEDQRRYDAMISLWNAIKTGNPLAKPQDLLASANDYLNWFNVTFKNMKLTTLLNTHKMDILAAIPYAQNLVRTLPTSYPDFVPNGFTADNNRAFTLVYTNVGKGSGPTGKLPMRLKIACHTDQGVLPPKTIDYSINMPGPGQVFDAWIVVEKSDVDFETGNAYDITFLLNPDREIKEKNDNYGNNSITKNSFIWGNDNQDFSMNEQNLDIVIKTPYAGDYAAPGDRNQLYLRVPYTNTSNAVIKGKTVTCKLSVYPHTAQGLATSPSVHEQQVEIPKPGQTLDAVMHPSDSLIDWVVGNEYKLVVEINTDKKVGEVNFKNNTFTNDNFKFQR